MEPASKDTQALRNSSIDRQFVESQTGQGHHSFDPLEIQCFSDIINQTLSSDPDLNGVLPLNPKSQDLFSAVESGVLMCKLVNSVAPGTIDENKINKKPNMNIFQKRENVDMAIAGAKTIGCILVNMNPQLIFERREHIILGFIWQLMRLKFVSKLNVKEMPTLLALKESNEKESDFAKASPEQLLLRWFNFHLENSEYTNRVTNFSSDLKNGLAYVYLLNQLGPDLSDKSGVALEADQRVKKVIEDAKKMGVDTPITGEDISSGNSKLNLLFSAAIFQKYPELKLHEKAGEQQKAEDAPLATIDRKSVV